MKAIVFSPFLYTRSLAIIVSAHNGVDNKIILSNKVFTTFLTGNTPNMIIQFKNKSSKIQSLLCRWSWY